jgi:hypothetical protein
MGLYSNIDPASVNKNLLLNDIVQETILKNLTKKELRIKLEPLCCDDKE